MKEKKTGKKKKFSIRSLVVPWLLIVVILTFSIVCRVDKLSDEKDLLSYPPPDAQERTMSDEKVNIAIAWHNAPGQAFASTVASAEQLDENVVLLEMVRSYDLEYDAEGRLQGATDAAGVLTPKAAKLVKANKWLNSNVEEVMQGVDCVIFPGGDDASPTLFYDEQDWHGLETDTDISAERDVSDYILMSYCIDNDIPVLAICRGMQMLAIVSGADMIQDLGNWFAKKGVAYNDQHRDPEKMIYMSHSVDVLSKDSLIYKITGKDKLEGCPSWHHQAVRDVDDTRLTVTGTADTNGVPVIEVIERNDRKFCLGVQFHPEIPVKKTLDNRPDVGRFMDYDTALSLFRAVADAGREYKTEHSN